MVLTGGGGETGCGGGDKMGLGGNRMGLGGGDKMGLGGGNTMGLGGGGEGEGELVPANRSKTQQLRFTNALVLKT